MAPREWKLPGTRPTENNRAKEVTVDTRIIREPRQEVSLHPDAELDREHLEAIRAFEAEHGRPMLPSELERFGREFYAPHYRAEVRRLAALGAEDDVVVADEDLFLCP